MFVSAAPTSPIQADQTDPTGHTPTIESCAGRLLTLVRKLVAYGLELAATLQRDPTNRPRHLGTGDIALILARIAQGLHRARALEERLIRNAARLDAPPKPPRSSSPLRSRPIPPPAPYRDRSNLHPADLPTPEQIAAAVRRRPIGAVIADICRDFRILPSHPLWREVSQLVVRHGGSLTALLRDIIGQAAYAVSQAWINATRESAFLQCPQHAGADPPICPA
jgi:hypothetical protein